jgi:hypothetical protein
VEYPVPARKGTKPPAAGRGRTKGVPNKLTLSVREMLTALVEHGLATAKEDYDRCPPAKKLALLAALSEYVLPRLQRTELDATINAPLEYQAWEDVDPVEAARMYQEMMQAGKKEGTTPLIVHRPSVKPYVPPPPKQEYLPAPPRTRSHAQPQESASPPPIVAAAPDDPGVTDTEAEATNVVQLEPLRDVHEHRPIADAKCAWCRKLWVQQ